MREPLEGEEKEEEAEATEDIYDDDDNVEEEEEKLDEDDVDGEPCVDLEQSTSAPVKKVYLSVMNCVLNHTK